ncbi:hypothetical protein [Streptomyces sp. NBC_00038]|uniref:hypothetical protein n=1 Tax=Streptomyces sp. NBC_00038 TaxID=2903615 RepID=UPI00225AE2E0|nr:hypothetical protein [Streptomyces sp. NBC_00038]MCX5562272.1 hypothetical protein [Streptomyces sp. NBC_00038]
MHDNSTTERAVDFLLGLIEAEAAERARQRMGPRPLPSKQRTGLRSFLGRKSEEAERPEDSLDARRKSYSWWTQTPVPSSVLLWVLEEDDPELNAIVWRHMNADDSMRRAIARGIPYGAGRTTAVPLTHPLRRDQEPPVPEHFTKYGLIGALRASTSMAPARNAGSMVLGAADWQTVTEADREHPLPGYARWVLAVRPDCPPALRAQFGSHAKFTHRVRQAGVIDGAAQYALSWNPAGRVLRVLSLGRTMFPSRVGEAEDALRPLVREHLGDREEAWAVLAQLIGTYHGTVPELVITAGAIA